MKVFEIPILDPILSIFITIYILWHVIKNYKNIFSVFLEKAPKSSKFEEFKKEIINKNNKIRDIHHIHIWSADGINTYITMHVKVEDNITVPEIIILKEKINNAALNHQIAHTTIEIEFESEECQDEECRVEISDERLHTHHNH